MEASEEGESLRNTRNWQRLLWLEGGEGEKGAQGKLEAWPAGEVWGLALALSRAEKSGVDSEGSAKL